MVMGPGLVLEKKWDEVGEREGWVTVDFHEQ